MTAPPPLGSITDVPGVRVGHHQRTGRGWQTGTTVVLVPGGATPGVDVRGGGPGTRETDALGPENLVEHVHAICLTGGSAYGLAAAHGVMTWLEARGLGFPIGPADASPPRVVPVVPAAVIFDLGRGGVYENRPDAHFGERAAGRARVDQRVWGDVGAGTGAKAGGLQGGVGTASTVVSIPGTDDAPPIEIVVGALAVVNANGSVVDPSSGLPWEPSGLTRRRPAAAEREVLLAMLDGQAAPRPSTAAHGLATTQAERGRSDTGRLNTTIGVVATSAALSKAEVGKFASVAHDGMARAIRPAHSMFDGDTIFGLATGQVELAGTETRLRVPGSRNGAFNLLLAAAAETFAAACTHAVLSASSTASLPSYFDLCPSAEAEMSDAPAILSTPADMRTWSMAQQRVGRTVALVPTMGALHRGHVELIRRAQATTDVTVVSIFVNPLQFDRADDFDRYPRPIDTDVAICADLGVDAVYAPVAGAMYEAGFRTTVTVSDLTSTMEGSARPGHFDGVATVVTKLFTAVRPHVAVFGEKDFQQLAVVRRLSADLDLGVEVIGCPTVREPDGLAMSSRNTRLAPAQRSVAASIPAALDQALVDAADGERSAARIARRVHRTLDAEPEIRVDYVAVFDASSLEAVVDIADDQRRPGHLRIAVAAFVGDVRLIDNRDLFEV